MSQCCLGCEDLLKIDLFNFFPPLFQTILAELRDITAATNTVSAPNSANGLRSEVTSSDSCNSLELLQDTDSLLSVLDSLPESDKHNPPPRSSARTNSGGQLPSPSVKQHQLTPASQLTPNKSRLVQPSRLSRPGTVSDHPRSPRSGSATTSASSNNTLNQVTNRAFKLFLYMEKILRIQYIVN